MRIRSALALAALPLLAAAAPGPERIPARTLQCTLGRMTNFDPHREQRADEIVYVGKHPFTLLIAAAPKRTTPPPEASDAPEPVNPSTRIVADPDGLTAKYPKRFDRIVDLWPDRVELSTNIDAPSVNVILVSNVDLAAGTARIFMAEAQDVATYDLAHLYGGDCRIG
jgi:hypothetical protein